MHSSRRFGRLLTALPFAAAVLLSPGVAPAVPFWGADQDITDGDVNETYSSSNGQRFLAMDDSNNLYIAFFDNRYKTGSDDNFEIFFRRFTYNFGSPSITRVTDKWGMSRYPSMAIRNWNDADVDTQNDSGRVYIVWQDARLFTVPPIGVAPRSYTIFMRTYRSKGGTGFGPELQVSPYDSLNAATLPVVAVGDSQRVRIVWQKPSDGTGTTDLYERVYHSNTGTFDAVAPVTSGTAFSGSASIAASRDGVVHLVWVDTRTGSQQIWARRFVPGSGWTAETQLVFTTGSASAPSIAADYAGRIHLVWVDSRDGNNEIYYKQYVPGVGWDAFDTRVTVNTLSQTQPYVDADPVGNAYVVWTDFRNGASNPDIYLDRRLGGAWEGNTALVYSATDPSNSIQRFAGITHDEFGIAYAAWSDERIPATLTRNKEVFYKVGYDVVTGVPVSEVPALSRLLRNYPNPFNPVTKIQFVLERDAQVTLRVFDVQGRLIRTLLDSYLASGPRVITWDGQDDRGVSLPSGTYFLRLAGGGTFLSRTVNLVK